MQGKRSSDGGKQLKAEARLRGKFKFSFSHLQQVGSFSSLFILCGIVNPMAIFFCSLSSQFF